METDRIRSKGLLADQALLAAVETRVAPLVFARKLAQDTVRVWVPGCATGEVAYVVAGALHANALRVGKQPTLQIFATDADERAIATARHGQYPEELASSFPPAWLQYFTRDGGHYQVGKPVRNLITFAQHRLLHDPPFARLDLVVCRNVLARLAPDAQAQILPILHWSLRPDGFLLVNATDEHANLSELFAPETGTAGLFQRHPGITTMQPMRHYVAQSEQQLADDALLVANHHLQAMNQVLRHKVGKLEQANSDLHNLLNASDLATIFLNRALQISRFTSQAQALFNLLPNDRGRLLQYITHTLNYDELVDDAANVLATLQASEREVAGADGRWYLVRLHPYPSADEYIEGVVLICLDISARRMAEEELRRARDELELRVLERTYELSAANTQLQAEIAERTRLEQERTELLRKLVLTQEDERRRIARELHDQLGQSVSALGMGLGMLAQPSPDAKQQQIVKRLLHITAQIDRDMRRLATELRPSLLDDLGLTEAIQHHVERWVERTGIQAEFQTLGRQQGRLPREIESVVYRMVQEALTNVLKHAQATTVSIILDQRHDQVQVIVEDDGRGFDLDALQHAPDVQQRLGLLGMRERVALVGGTVTIETAIGSGTAVFVQLPLAADAIER